MKHLLSIEELSSEDLENLINDSIRLKATRGLKCDKNLEGQTWAMVFSKSSTRTRVSFEVGIRELGGFPLFLSNNDIQLGRGEPIKDTARVLGRMVHGLIIRTFAQKDIEEFAYFSGIPVINALTDDEHPCQILADLLTIKEIQGGWDNKEIAFIGDGFSNMTRSWMWAAKKLGFTLRLASPKPYQAPVDFIKALDCSNIRLCDSPQEALDGAHVVNTDVWLSMGQENQLEKENEFKGYQLNFELMKRAAKDAIVLHCLPAYRGKEISEELLEVHANTIFQQAENRLHVQKAVMLKLSN